MPITPGGDRCQQRTAGELVGGVQIGEKETVGGRLFDLRELPAIAQLYRRPCRGVRVAQDVEDIDAVPSVHVHFLIDDARSDAELFTRLVEERQPRTGPISTVHILLDAQIGLHGADIAAVTRVVGNDSRRRGASDRNVGGEFDVSTGSAAANLVAGELGDRFRDAQLRLIGDVANGA